MNKANNMDSSHWYTYKEYNIEYMQHVLDEVDAATIRVAISRRSALGAHCVEAVLRRYSPLTIFAGTFPSHTSCTRLRSLYGEKAKSTNIRPIVSSLALVRFESRSLISQDICLLDLRHSRVYLYSSWDRKRGIWLMQLVHHYFLMSRWNVRLCTSMWWFRLERAITRTINVGKMSRVLCACLRNQCSLCRHAMNLLNTNINTKCGYKCARNVVD